MSALTDRIAAEHSYTWTNAECACDASRHVWMEDFAAHIAEVTEAAVREQVAQDIEAERDDPLQCDPGCEVCYGLNLAARIARGEQ